MKLMTKICHKFSSLIGFLVISVEAHQQYFLMRRLLIFGLGLIYLVNFKMLWDQGLQLIGSMGLIPSEIPDFSIQFFSVLGMIGGVLLMVGRANFPVLFILWWMQFQLVQKGEVFWGYGWEMQLLELTFLSCLICPLTKWNLKRSDHPPLGVGILALRWMLFRLMMGAGLIKLRGDPCWRDLTCLNYHFETQPNPNFLTPFFHFLPDEILKLGVLGNHFVEVVVPFFYFAPKWLRRGAGVITLLFQIILILSGNLAYLNWISLVMVIPCFDDEFIRLVMGKIGFGLNDQKIKIKDLKFSIFKLRALKVLSVTILVSLIYFSQNAFFNLLSPDQSMNRNHDPFFLVNSYGAFGSIGREQLSLVFSGTLDKNINSASKWKEYQFKCRPGDVKRLPCWISPYHLRLDWQLWFSAMRPYLSEEWLIQFVIKLLNNDKYVMTLIDHNPFKDNPPKFIKIDLYRYELLNPYKFQQGKIWERKFIGPYLNPVKLVK
jgi:hypothetical protein